MITSATTLEQLQRLRQTFFELLPARVSKIGTAWSGLAGGAWNAEAAKELRLALHNLTGAAGTFGLPDISRMARAAELKLESLLETSGVPAPERLAEMAKTIAALQQGMEHARPHPLNIELTAGVALRRLVYMIDDDRDFSQDTALQLGYFGYDVRCFEKPGALRAALQQERPAAILVDIVFPDDVPGTVAVQELRDSYPELPPLVFISVREDFAARLGAVRAGCSAYFTKPLDISALVDRLDRLTRSEPQEPYRVLIVDDSQLVAATHAMTLKHAGIETAVVTNPMAVTTKLADFMPDLILMDVNMPECNGIELAVAIRQFETYVGIPIVFLSAETDRDLQLSAMRQGGDDFLTKPIRPKHLIASVQARVERARILRTFMLRDSLTGLLNHTHTKEQLATEVARVQRVRGDLALAMIDIDFFKTVNDTYGHPVGDRVIRSLARLLKQRLRVTDIVGRYGGEEFIAILPGIKSDQAREVLDNIRASYSAVRFLSPKGEFGSSFSCGIAVFPAFDSPVQLLDAADRALYEAKHAGRDRVVIAGS